MTLAKLKKAWKNEYIQTAIMILLIIAAVFGFWYGTKAVLNTDYPALAVASGSMCLPQGMYCDGWTHPFARTLHIGDLIVVQGINPETLNVGDIIVFHRPSFSPYYADELIVHRIIAKEYNPSTGLVYFETKGDANPVADSWNNDYRGANYTWQGMVSEKLVVGRVIMRIPWLGHISLFMRNSSGLLIIAVLIIIIVLLEFVLPAFSRKETPTKPEPEAKENPESAAHDS